MSFSKTWAAALMLCLTAHATAQENTDTWLLRGFGSLSATRTSDSGTGYVSYPQNSGRATTNDWSVANDSLLGIQLDALPDQKLSATAQIIARHRARDRVEPLVEWTFMKYRHDDNWTVQLGRLLTPVQMDAENRFVAYSNTTVRADLSAYSLYPLSNHDGLNVSYERMLGDAHMELLGFAGSASIELPASADGQSVFVTRPTWSRASG